jgi:hypothetical protein
MTTQGIQANRRNGGTLEAFDMHIMTIIDNLRSLGDMLEDLKIVWKFLSVSQIATPRWRAPWTKCTYYEK